MKIELTHEEAQVLLRLMKFGLDQGSKLLEGPEGELPQGLYAAVEREQQDAEALYERLYHEIEEA